MNKIIFENVDKTYKRLNKKALEDFSLEINRGNILGLLGPNGAGKSTYIKLLVGIIKRDSGNISVFGKDPEVFKFKDLSNLGVYMTGKNNLIDLLPAMDTLKLTKAIYKIKDNDFEKNIDEYSSLLRCKKNLNQPVNTLSLGQRVRMELLNILVHNPDLIILDEPTNGLDIEGKISFNLILRKICDEKGKTIVLATHDINAANNLCNKLILLKQGKKQLELEKDEVDKYIKKYMIIETDGQVLKKDIITSLIPKTDKVNRLLIDKVYLDEIKNNSNKFIKDFNIINFEEPILEDMLYEYYR